MDDKTLLGNLAEIKVASHLAERGYEIFWGVGGKTSCDLVVIKDNVASRVQVKGCSFKNGPSWQVELKSVRSNKTVNKIHNFDSSKCELLAIYIQPEDRVVVLDASLYNDKTAAFVKSG